VNEKKDILVVGLGNPLMGDEGIGVCVLEAVSRDASSFPGVEFLDLGTGGMKVLHAIAGRRKVVFVDCAVMGGAPGAIRRFTVDEVRSQKVLGGVSLHEADLFRLLELSRRLGECPQEVVIFGIEPARVAEGEGLSAAVRERVDEYVRAVKEELAQEPDAPA